MSNLQRWMGSLVLRSPRALRSLRNAPVLGGVIHWLSHRVLPADQKVWAQIEAGPLQGIWVELNPRTGQSYLEGTAEIPVQTAIAQHLRAASVFYDLGANIGLFSLLAARIVGPAGRVFSFEPDAEVAARLRRNIERNGFSQVSVIEAALWSSSGSINFAPAESSSPDQGTGQIVTGNGIAATPVRCVALDDFVQTAPLPDAIKCDVEGAEIEALRGAEKLLQKCHPWILCEMHSESNDRACREFLSRLGYSFDSLDANHILALPPGGSPSVQDPGPARRTWNVVKVVNSGGLQAKRMY